MTDPTLSFDDGHATPGAVTCSRCGTPVTEYWSVNGAVLCERCRDEVLAEWNPKSGTAGRVGKALLFGGGGMLLGAGVWAAVEYYAHYQLALIAILLGFLVGKGIYLGSGKRGGRRYQILALILTWLGYGLASTPSAINEFRQAADSMHVTDSLTAPDSTRVATTADSLRPAAPMSDSALDAEIATLDTAIAKGPKHRTVPSPGVAGGAAVILLGLGAAFLFLLSLPILIVVGSGSPILALIYAFGLYEAWKFTRATPPVVTGPHLVGASTG